MLHIKPCLFVLAAVITLSGHSFVSAREALVLDPAGQGVRAVGAQLGSGSRTLPTEQRAPSIADAQLLLDSSEGAAWHVYGVQAAEGCSVAQQRKPARTGKIVNAKDCREQRQILEKAKKFAAKHGVSVTSSSLYTLTTVLLSTKAAEAK